MRTSVCPSPSRTSSWRAAAGSRNGRASRRRSRRWRSSSRWRPRRARARSRYRSSRSSGISCCSLTGRARSPSLPPRPNRTDFEVARIMYGLFSAGLLEVSTDEEVEKRRLERAQQDKVLAEVRAKQAEAEAKAAKEAMQRETSLAAQRRRSGSRKRRRPEQAERSPPGGRPPEAETAEIEDRARRGARVPHRWRGCATARGRGCLRRDDGCGPRGPGALAAGEQEPEPEPEPESHSNRSPNRSPRHQSPSQNHEPERSSEPEPERGTASLRLRSNRSRRRRNQSPSWQSRSKPGLTAPPELRAGDAGRPRRGGGHSAAGADR